MFVDSCTYNANGKKYTRHLLRESFRRDGKVKHRTIANVSHCSSDEIQALKLALKHKANLQLLGNINEDIQVQQGLAVGALCTLWQVAKRIGLVKCLGASQQGKRALWQVFARVLEQGSRLSAVRLANAHAACDVLALDAFDEDDLYENLDWLAEQQQQIEDRLFRERYAENKPTLYLYDVTSSYLEGTCNELAAFGYNRDRKSGKPQIVYGLLCDEQGRPVSIEAFVGNTNDTKTFASQVRKVATRFSADTVTLVGDRGMIKAPQIEQIQAEDSLELHYITAITKPQIEKLLKQNVIQMNLFDETVAEVVDDEVDVRYVLRRNPQRAMEVAFAVGSALGRSIMKQISIPAFVFIRNLVGGIVFFCLAIILYGPEHFAHAFSADLWLVMTVYAALVVVLGQMTWFRAVGALSSGVVSAWSTLTPVLGILFAYLIVHEIPDMSQWVAALIIIGGLVITQLRPARIATTPRIVEKGLAGA